jgi:suppressor for copper-sensitivity B
MSKILPVLLVFLINLAGHSRAGESPWAVSDQVRARLLSDGNAQAALEVELADGWHSYWQSPGDAGLPPRFDWTGSENVAGVDVSWPYPKRFDEMGIATFGYEGRILFPLDVKPVKEGDKMKLSLVADIMVCSDICIPQQLKLLLDLSEAGPQGAIIDAAKRRIPSVNSALSIEAVIAGPDAIVITASSPKGFDGADVFAVAGDIAFTAKPEITPDAKDARKAMIRIAKPAVEEDLATFLAGKDLKIVLVAGNIATEKSIRF